MLADDEVVLEALPTCVSETRPVKYEPIGAGEYLRERLEATYSSSVGGNGTGLEG